MNTPLGLLALLIHVAATLSARAGEIPIVPPAAAGLSAEKIAEVDRFMERQVSENQIAGGIVLVWHRGRIGCFNSYGWRDREAGKPMAPDTLFRLYSMSKAITTAAALTLYDQGRIGLDDPVSKYIPAMAQLQVATTNGLRAPTRPVTVRDLMLHTAGFTYGDGPDALKEAYKQLKPLESATLAELVEKLSQAPLAFDPGTDWGYGMGTDVLGRVIEIVSGEGLDVFLERTIFKPLRMIDTAFTVAPEKIDRFAVNYSRSPEGLKVRDAATTSEYAKPVTLFSGGGGLVGTARDYLRFLVMIENGGQLDGQRILRSSTTRLMTRNQLPEAAFPIHFGAERRAGTGFGLGFSVRTQITDWDPAGEVGEYGWGGAASTHYWVSPRHQLIVITLEQIMPYQWDTEFGVKKIIYDAITR
jgi:CubicO group peptidase (beta-lactamase class C family)